jgi:hypothetical protein
MPNDARSSAQAPSNAAKERSKPADLQPKDTNAGEGGDEQREGLPQRTPTASQAAIKQEHKSPGESGSTG